MLGIPQHLEQRHLARGQERAWLKEGEGMGAHLAFSLEQAGWAAIITEQGSRLLAAATHVCCNIFLFVLHPPQQQVVVMPIIDNSINIS